MNNQPSLKINFGMNAILTVSSLFFPIITFPYVSRVLQPGGMGKVSFALSIVSYFTMISQLGIPTYGIRAVARVRDNREELTRVTHELLFINLIMSLISYGVLFIMILTVPRLSEERLLITVVSASIILDAIGTEWLYKGLEQYTYITVRSIIFKVISIIAMFLLVHDTSDYVIYGGISVFAASAANIINFINIGRHVDIRPVGSYDLKKYLKSVLVFFAMTCATTVYLNLDTAMLGFMTDDEEVGYYHASVRIKSVLTALITSLGAVLLPRISYYIEKGEKERFREVCMKAFRFVMIAAVPTVVYFIIFAKETVLFISGGDYTGSILPMRIIMPTVLFIGLSNIIGIQIFIPFGEEKKVLHSEIAGAIVDVIINLLLIPRFRSAGAAAGTLAAEAVVLLVQAGAFRRMVKEKKYEAMSFPGFFKGLYLFQVAAAVIIATGASVWVKFFGFGNFLTLAVSAPLFFGVYTGVYALSGGKILR